jgi:hypothetical protein
MRSIIFATAIGSILAFGPGCGGGEGDDDDDDTVDGGGDDDDDDDIDAGGGDFQNLITRTWTIPPGEYYRCARLTIDEDMFISAIRPLGPLGTHHTVLSVNSNPTQPDGDFNCSAGDLEPQMLFASGVGSDDLAFPEGVGLRIRAGQQLNLNLHLYNTSDADLTGESGSLVKVVDSVEQEAEALFSGTASLAIVSNNGTPQDFSGGCTFDQDATLVAVWPHQHQYGTHHKFEIHRDGGDTEVVLDEDYSFFEQKNYPLDPLIEIAAGDEVETTCTYVNESGSTIFFGDSSTTEMCFTGLYRYPATGDDLFSCTNLPF